MPVLVEYRCGDCGRGSERWATPPLPSLTECDGCAGPARRRFGGALLTGGSSPSPAPSGDGCAPGVPGSCTLVPTASRMLEARMRGDNRAIDRESAHQEKAIKNGTLNPNGSLTTTFAGGPTATA